MSEDPLNRRSGIQSFHQLPWLRVLVEGVVIVGSILLAFGIDAWWDEKQRRGEEQLVLESVLQEFESIRSNYSQDRLAADAVRESILQLLRISTARESEAPNQNIDKLLADLTWTIPETNYSAPVLTSVISNGDFSLISSPTLRLELGVWPVRLDDVARFLDRDINELLGRYLPYLERNGSLLQIVNAVDCKPGLPNRCWDYGDRIYPESSHDHSDLMSDMDFQGLLSTRLILISDLIDFAFSDLEIELSSTIEMLEQEMAN